MTRIAIRSFSPSISLQTTMQNVTNRTAKRYVFAIIKLFFNLACYEHAQIGNYQSASHFEIVCLFVGLTPMHIMTYITYKLQKE